MRLLPRLLRSFIKTRLKLFHLLFKILKLSKVPVQTYKPLIKRSCSIWSRSNSDEPHQVRQDVPVLSNHFVRKRMQNEWSMRGVCEFERSVSSFFVTLTYDDVHLPRMNDGRPAFCPTHLDFFLDYIRSRLEYDGIGKTNMKYFIVSEKGSKKGRSHYHCVFYFSVPIVSMSYQVPTYSKKLGPVKPDLLSKVDLHVGYFRGVVNKAWPFGFSDVQVPRNGAAVVRYISGYVTKDMFSMDISTSKMSPDVREIHTLYRPYKTISKSCPRDFIPGKTYNAIFTTYNFHRQSLHFGDNILDAITPMNWMSGCMTKVIDGEVYTFALPKYARDKMLRTLEYFVDEHGVKRCRSKQTPLGKQVREIMCRKRTDTIFQWLDDMKNDENLCYVRDKLGIDFDYNSTFISLYYNTNECHVCADFKEDFYDYLLNRRGWRFQSFTYPVVKKDLFNNKSTPSSGGRFFSYSSDGISGTWTSPMGDILQVLPVVDLNGNLKPPLWNSWYQGYEYLIKLYDDVQFSFDCAKQREDEYKEFIKKRNKFLGYGRRSR